VAAKRLDGTLDRLGLEPRPRHGVARLVALLALLAFFGAILAIVIASTRRDSSTAGTTSVSVTPTRTRTTTPRLRKPPPAPPARLLTPAGAQAFDPDGDHVENDGEAGFAIDRNLTTFWSTEHYTSFSKPGVGLIVDLGRAAAVQQVRLATDTPGYRAQIEVGAAATGPFRTVAPGRDVAGGTTFRLRKPVRARYVTVWITAIPTGGEAHVNEVRVSGR